MRQITFKYSALYYLNQWISKDSGFCDALDGFDEKRRLEAMKDAAVFYRVARNLPTAHDKSKRYKLLLDVLLNQPPLADDSSLVRSIYAISAQISNAYDCKSVLSLTTKFLWLRQKRPLIMYDSRVRKALRSKAGDLDDYYTQWRERFRDNQSHIQSACASLRGVRQYCIDPDLATVPYIDDLAATDWFQEIVLDAYLWHTGA